MKKPNNSLLIIGHFQTGEKIKILNSESIEDIEQCISKFNSIQIFEVFCVLEYLNHRQKDIAYENQIYNIFIAYYSFIHHNLDRYDLHPVAAACGVNTSVDRLNLGRRLAF